MFFCVWGCFFGYSWGCLGVCWRYVRAILGGFQRVGIKETYKKKQRIDNIIWYTYFCNIFNHSIQDFFNCLGRFFTLFFFNFVFRFCVCGGPFLGRFWRFFNRFYSWKLIFGIFRRDFNNFCDNIIQNIIKKSVFWDS